MRGRRQQAAAAGCHTQMRRPPPGAASVVARSAVAHQACSLPFPALPSSMAHHRRTKFTLEELRTPAALLDVYASVERCLERGNAPGAALQLVRATQALTSAPALLLGLSAAAGGLWACRLVGPRPGRAQRCGSGR